MPKPKPTATVSIDNPTPSHGDTVVISVTSDVRSLVHVVCTNDEGIVLSGGGKAYPAGSYTEDVTLVSPSFLSGSASCTATVKTWGDGGKLRLQEIASLEFEVSE